MTTADPGPVAAFAPAKVNLTLHITGRRSDGYHLIDSLVVFADVGDRLTVALADKSRLRVTGPTGTGVPTGDSNLVLRAARFFGAQAEISLEKHLPAEAGIGGGSSDAAATLRALSGLTGRPIPKGAESLGADVPVCLTPRATRMGGIGERLNFLPAIAPLQAVLVNPGVSVPTPSVFARMETRDNPAMPDTLPDLSTRAALLGFLATTRNDLEPAARAIAPDIGDVVALLSSQTGCDLARMSGSGATCFGLFSSRDHAIAAADSIKRSCPDWWVHPCVLA
ncbi:MAG: 4-(cytidine 5'-diphospho)-2-C-methyl-D-erythritol kinase [Pseudooceanicola sp.]